MSEREIEAQHGEEKMKEKQIKNVPQLSNTVCVSSNLYQTMLSVPDLSFYQAALSGEFICGLKKSLKLIYMSILQENVSNKASNL